MDYVWLATFNKIEARGTKVGEPNRIIPVRSIRRTADVHRTQEVFGAVKEVHRDILQLSGEPLYASARSNIIHHGGNAREGERTSEFPNLVAIKGRCDLDQIGRASCRERV